MKSNNTYFKKSETEADLSNDEITKTLQIGRLAECGNHVLKPYNKKVSENPKLGKLKIGPHYIQYISQIKRLYNTLNDEKELYDNGELSSDAICFLNIITKSEDSIGVTLDQILQDEGVFNSIIKSENPQEIKQKAKIAEDNLNKVYSYMHKKGIGAIVSK